MSTSLNLQDSNGEFDWDDQTQGFVLGAFYYGFFATQIVGGVLAEKYGGKNLYGGGVLLAGAITLLYPVAAQASVWCLFTLRALQGVAEGVCIPALYVMNSKWLPESEKGLFVTIIFSGK